MTRLAVRKKGTPMKKNSKNHMPAICCAGMAIAVLLCQGCESYSVLLKSTPPAEQPQPYAFKFFVAGFVIANEETSRFFGEKNCKFIQNEYSELLATRYPEHFTIDPENALPVTFVMEFVDYKTSGLSQLTVLCPYLISAGTLPLMKEGAFSLSVKADVGTVSARQNFSLEGSGWGSAFSPIGAMMPYRKVYDYAGIGFIRIEQTVGSKYVTETPDVWLSQFLYAVKKMDQAGVLKAYERLYGNPLPAQDVPAAEPKAEEPQPAPKQEEQPPKPPERVFLF